jgi:hypothetical protein
LIRVYFFGFLPASLLLDETGCICCVGLLGGARVTLALLALWVLDVVRLVEIVLMGYRPTIPVVYG